MMSIVIPAKTCTIIVTTFNTTWTVTFVDTVKIIETCNEQIHSDQATPTQCTEEDNQDDETTSP